MCVCVCVCVSGRLAFQRCSLASRIQRIYNALLYKWEWSEYRNSDSELLTAPILNEKNMCREWESNPRNPGYKSGVLTTAPSRQPCWQQSNRWWMRWRVSHGVPPGVFLHSGTGQTSDHPRMIHRLYIYIYIDKVFMPEGVAWLMDSP